MKCNRKAVSNKLSKAYRKSRWNSDIKKMPHNKKASRAQLVNMKHTPRKQAKLGIKTVVTHQESRKCYREFEGRAELKYEANIHRRYRNKRKAQEGKIVQFIRETNMSYTSRSRQL